MKGPEGFKGHVVYNKLVRDKVPDVIRQDGHESEIKTLSEEEFVEALRDKAIEEARELKGAESREALISELADMSEVLETLAKVKGITSEEIASARSAKAEERGSFENRTFLLSSTNVKYSPEEEK